MVYLEVIGEGGCFIGSNPTHTFLELKHLFEISLPKLLIIEPELLKSVLPATRDVVYLLIASSFSIPAAKKFTMDSGHRKSCSKPERGTGSDLAMRSQQNLRQLLFCVQAVLRVCSK
jgi:hypothetical protein